MSGLAAVAEVPGFAVRQEGRSAGLPTKQRASAQCSSAAGGAPLGQPMPLSFLKCGESASVLKVRGGGELHHHLENLGFVEGARVKVVGGMGGDLIVDVKGAQVALGRKAAQSIVAVPAA